MSGGKEQAPNGLTTGSGDAPTNGVPGRPRRRRRRVARALLLGGAAALVSSRDLRNRLLDALFGPEEEFEYES